MTGDALSFISRSLEALGINYEFMEWNSDPIYPYFVGEYQESTPVSEDGCQNITFIINGFSRTTWQSLEEVKNKIENCFDKTYGKTVIADSGNAVAVFYDSAFPIREEDAELKRIQINLTVKEWKVN